MISYIFRFYIPSKHFTPKVNDIVNVVIAAPCREEADACIKFAVNPDLKLFMVERYDEENKKYVEEDLF